MYWREESERLHSDVKDAVRCVKDREVHLGVLNVVDRDIFR